MKTTILISYDLVAKRDYTRLTNAIKALNPGSWCRVLESLWLVLTALSCAQVRDHLGPYMDQDDKLFVTRAGPDWASRNLPSDVVNWLKVNLS